MNSPNPVADFVREGGDLRLESVTNSDAYALISADVLDGAFVFVVETCNGEATDSRDYDYGRDCFHSFDDAFKHGRDYVNGK